MKKVLVSVVSLLFVLCILAGNTLAYSNKNYSIDVPSKYQKYHEGDTTVSFMCDNTKQLGISVLDTSEKEDEAKLVKDILDGKKDVKKMVDYLLDENPDMTEDNIKKSEIISISENKYDAIHIAMEEEKSGKTGYYHAYMMLTDDHIYMITFVSIDEDMAKSSDIKDALDSFEIKNEEVYSSKNKKDSKKDNNTILYVAIIAGAVVLITLVLGIIIAICAKKK